MATPTPAHVSWLSKVGHVITNVLRVIVTDAAPVEKIAVPVAKALLPGFIPEIDFADGIFSNIVKEAVAAEALATSAGQATGSGPQKLAQVLAQSGPVLDAWVAANFPGAKAVSDIEKADLINAVVAILNKISGGAPVVS